MLHMVIMRHSEESCPGRPGNEAVIPCVNKMQELLKARSIGIVGRWADPPGHVNYLVLDAPHGEAVVHVIMESGLAAYTTSEIHPC